MTRADMLVFLSFVLFINGQDPDPTDWLDTVFLAIFLPKVEPA